MFYLGLGLGGHCIPIDFFYLSWVVRKYDILICFIELVGEINVLMLCYVIDRVVVVLNDCGKVICGSCIVILGVVYKKDVDDFCESLLFVLMKLLGECGAVMSYNDLYISKLFSMCHYQVF